MKHDVELVGLVTAVLRRFFRQNGREVPAKVEAVAERLSELVTERGLPRPLEAGDAGAPGSLLDEVCAPLVARVLGGERDPLLADAVKQLVKACFYPEFTVCRDSFRERKSDGTCKRQELARVRGRVSGTHCVDCPYWVQLDAAEHARFVAGEWQRGAADFAAEQAIYLPEDFRALRKWLHAAARRTC